ncbi:hypothetical protein GXW82_17945 [Streptacidiphilus sp. 4-A2]|nr:hypothetical protein [Streptacidiphilus sp. 4-A2]
MLTVDSRGLATALRDPRGKITTMAYDGYGNLTSTTTRRANAPATPTTSPAG